MGKLKLLFFALIITCCTTLKDSSFTEILDNANEDIKVDSVKYFTAGLPFIRPVIVGSKDTTFVDSIEIKRQKLKDIYKKYGLYEMNLGCVIDKQTSIVERKYKKITNPYLEKRNGKGWKEKMNKEIEKLNLN